MYVIPDHIYDRSSSSPFVMIIDDSSTIRKIIEISLSREGYTVIGFPDGIAALQWLAEGHYPPPNLALLDIILPKIDGYSLARMFKAKPTLQRMTIIMMSRRDGLVDRLKGRLMGAKEYITKPFKTEELIATVKRYLNANQLLIHE